MSKKTTAFSLIIFGLLFSALGAFLFMAQSGTPVVIVIAVLDILFGILLVFGGLRAKDMPSDDKDEQVWQPEETERPAPARESARPVAVEPDSFDDDISSEPIDESDLASREGELRVAAQKAADEANKAKKAATQAIKEARSAEEELDKAEEQLMQMSPAEQRAAMRQVDQLAQIAAEKSEIATKASQKARVAIEKAKKAAELHSRAMDAAVDAMSGEDEFAEFD